MRNFQQLLYHERYKIYTGLCEGKSKREIAKIIGRSVSTVTREINRNSDRYGYLYAGAAHEAAKKRKHINAPKIDRDPKLKAYIIKKLEEKWSPATIAAQWELDYPNRSLCKETIYQWLYSNNGEEKIKLRKLLVRAHKKRGLKVKKNKSTIKNRVSIHDRPDNINSRIEAGHFECDLIFNDGSQSQNVCTLIERTTRKAFLIYNDNKSTKTVMNALIKRIYNERLFIKSITFDNGTEFADHGRLKELGIDTYFCDPGKPWQKGGIENLNGMLRRFLPFSLPAAIITEQYVAKVNKKINNMPREILSWKTPSAIFKKIFKITKKEGELGEARLADDRGDLFSQKNLSVAFHS